MNQEVFKSVPGYEGCYSVSNYGNVQRDKKGWGHCKIGKILKPSINKKGYLYLGLTMNGKRKTFFIARLVMLAFYGPPINGLQVNHKDFCKSNNHISNLEYTTNLENMRHSYKYGQRRNTHARGIKNGNNHLTEKAVKTIREKYTAGNISQRLLAREYNVCQRTIHLIVTQKTWAHI